MPSPIKRFRRTNAQLAEIRDHIVDVLTGDHPQTVRHVFYRLGKQDYNVIQRQLLRLRENDVVPWSWVSDGTRWRRVQAAFDSPADAVEHVARFYRRDVWRRTPVYVEVWCESDSIAGVLIEETERYNVPLMVSRGFSSRTYLYHAAQEIKKQDRPAFIYYIGDWDASGKIIPENIEAQLRKFAPDAEIHFERLLVTPEQIEQWDLPTKPAKRNTHSKGFTGGTVEAEAVPAHVTRALLRKAIERHLDLQEVRVLETAEESERDGLFAIADAMRRTA